LPFIGNQPALSYTSFAKQDFTTSATTSYTLDHPVTNENEIALFINFVRQEPTTAYTASNTTLTLTSATSASDDMYCVFLGKAVQTVNPPNSSVGNSQLDVSAINSQTAETSIAGGDEVLIYDTSASALRKMTRTNFVSGIGGTNTPAFLANLSGDQSISDGTVTTLQFNTESFDTDSMFDTSTYRFTPTTAGKYWVYAKGRVDSASDFDVVAISIRKNGTKYSEFRNTNRYYDTVFSGVIITFNGSSDYVDVVMEQGSGGSLNVKGGTSHQARAEFGAYKLIGV
jgi:hypothetical protein